MDLSEMGQNCVVGADQTGGEEVPVRARCSTRDGGL